MAVLFLQRKDLGDFSAFMRDDFLELIQGRPQPSAGWRLTQKTIDAVSQLLIARSARACSEFAMRIRRLCLLFSQNVVRHQHNERPTRRMKD